MACEDYHPPPPPPNRFNFNWDSDEEQDEEAYDSRPNYNEDEEEYNEDENFYGQDSSEHYGSRYSPQYSEEEAAADFDDVADDVNYPDDLEEEIDEDIDDPDNVVNILDEARRAEIAEMLGPEEYFTNEQDNENGNEECVNLGNDDNTAIEQVPISQTELRGTLPDTWDQSQSHIDEQSLETEAQAIMATVTAVTNGPPVSSFNVLESMPSLELPPSVVPPHHFREWSPVPQTPLVPPLSLADEDPDAIHSTAMIANVSGRIPIIDSQTQEEQEDEVSSSDTQRQTREDFRGAPPPGLSLMDSETEFVIQWLSRLESGLLSDNNPSTDRTVRRRQDHSRQQELHSDHDASLTDTTTTATTVTNATPMTLRNLRFGDLSDDLISVIRQLQELQPPFENGRGIQTAGWAAMPRSVQNVISATVVTATALPAGTLTEVQQQEQPQIQAHHHAVSDVPDNEGE